MSLSIDGVWKAGVWATTVWADGVWHEGAASVPEPEATATGGYYDFPYRKRKRYRLPDDEPETREAVAIVERVAEAIADDRPKRDDVELSLRLALLQQDIIYRDIYLKMAFDIIEEQNREMMIEEEAAIVLYAVMN